MTKIKRLLFGAKRSDYEFEDRSGYEYKFIDDSDHDEVDDIFDYDFVNLKLFLFILFHFLLLNYA